MFRIAAAAVAVFAFSCGVGQSEVTVSGDDTASADQDLRKNNPCMTVRCSAGTHCEAHGQQAGCVADTCKSDADCRLVDNYCDGCACDALLNSAPDPVCGGTTVACFAQPCAGKVAKCDRGTCVSSTSGKSTRSPFGLVKSQATVLQLISVAMRSTTPAITGLSEVARLVTENESMPPYKMLYELYCFVSCG